MATICCAYVWRTSCLLHTQISDHLGISAFTAKKQFIILLIFVCPVFLENLVGEQCFVFWQFILLFNGNFIKIYVRTRVTQGTAVIRWMMMAQEKWKMTDKETRSKTTDEDNFHWSNTNTDLTCWNSTCEWSQVETSHVNEFLCRL